MTGMLPLHVDAVDLAEQADRRDEARQADAEMHRCVVCGRIRRDVIGTFRDGVARDGCDDCWDDAEARFEREQDR